MKPLSFIRQGRGVRKYLLGCTRYSVQSSQSLKALDSVKSVNAYTQRTHNCGELRAVHKHQSVNLFGWLHYLRMNKFLILRDAYGTVQVLLPEHLFNKLEYVPLESVLNVLGTVALRPPEQTNSSLATGEIEVVANDVKVVSMAGKQLPFHITSYNKAKENLQMEYRYLALRFSDLQNNLRLRSRLLMDMRHFLTQKVQFVDVETPTLFIKTPGGAQEFLVPSRFPGKFYSLVQSPQQFKQMLMVGGMDRYFQIARCYRDESTTPERQPEFTQLDLEMSFTTQKDVMCLVEDLLSYAWPSHLAKIPKRFPVMSYNDAMSTYGTDKPDTRYSMRIEDVTEIMDVCKISSYPHSHSQGSSTLAICIPKGKILKLHKKSDLVPSGTRRPVIADIGPGGIFNGKFIANFGEETCRQLLTRLECSESDVVVMQTGPKENVLPALGAIRVRCAHELQDLGERVFDPDVFNFLWVVDFPLFMRDEDGNWESTHHPFTAPIPDHEELVYTDPGRVTAQHYDLVLNGSEVGGGSIRIHDHALQKYVMEDVLRLDSSKLEHFMEALRMGCPPHGGIALGVDRLVSLLCHCTSIRQVIAFPKGLQGKDPVSGAPAPVSPEELAVYHLLVDERFK